jgi:DNA repair photolyase
VRPQTQSTPAARLSPASPPAIFMTISQTTISKILTRASGYLKPVASHSLQPYRGCALGNSLCGVGCYVQHNYYLTRGKPWGSFVEARVNASDAYRSEYEAEKRWAHRRGEAFGIFMSSSTEPFQPLEKKMGITRSVLEEMVELPPDVLIVQTHSHHVADYIDLYPVLSLKTDLRFNISIECDRDELPGLPRSASPVSRRIEAARKLKEAGLYVMAALSPLLPNADAHRFFKELSGAVNSVVIDHYVGGDGSCGGSRTNRTRLPAAMAELNPASVDVAYREEMVKIAQGYFPGRVGTGNDGFARRFLP